MLWLLLSFLISTITVSTERFVWCSGLAPGFFTTRIIPVIMIVMVVVVVVVVIVIAIVDMTIRTTTSVPTSSTITTCGGASRRPQW